VEALTQPPELTSPSSLAQEAVVSSRSLVDLVWQLQWRSDHLEHTETFFTALNVWRELDLCPAGLARDLPGKSRGSTLAYHFAAGELVPDYDARQIRPYPRQSFAQGQLAPGLGRFYPLALLRDFPQMISPFRCVGLAAETLTADLNHPLAGKPLDLALTVARIHRKRGETGGQCQEWLAHLLDGPGQQARWRSQPTAFFQDDAFVRPDERPDEQFYAQPRLVSHLDRQARQTITGLYGKLLRPGWRVLDLMSSWQSHLPESHGYTQVIGLGLNDAELRRNPQLTGHLCHDLNEAPYLPFGEASFDAVVCTASVEYLTRPLEVFAEVRRVLRPGGIFVVTFSNRWFPPKVIRIWTELLDYERLGLVLECFLQVGGFTDLATFSARGWPRPPEDKYFPQVRFSDPVFAAWGRKAG